MKRLLITHGDYAGRYLTMEDDQASEAISSGFALDGETDVPQEQIDEHVQQADEDVTAKSREFFERTTNPNAPQREDDKTEHRQARAPKPKEAAHHAPTRSRRAEDGD